MNLVCVCVRDVCANVFMSPFFAQSVGSAMRSFESEVNRVAEDNMLYKHPRDFELYQLGTFEPTSGKLELLPDKLQLCTAMSVMRAQPNDTRQLPLAAV